MGWPRDLKRRRNEIDYTALMCWISSIVKGCLPLLLLVFTLFSFGCRVDPAKERAASSRSYRDHLVVAANVADEIIISEHSDPHDFDQPRPESTEPALVYRTHTLSATERQRLVDLFEKMSPAPREAELACAPVYHHTIRFVSKRGGGSVMNICFHCSQIRWDADSDSSPAALIPALTTGLEELGFHSQRDWKALTKAGKEGADR